MKKILLTILLILSGFIFGYGFRDIQAKKTLSDQAQIEYYNGWGDATEAILAGQRGKDIVEIFTEYDAHCLLLDYISKEGIY